MFDPFMTFQTGLDSWHGGGETLTRRLAQLGLRNDFPVMSLVRRNNGLHVAVNLRPRLRP